MMTMSLFFISIAMANLLVIYSIIKKNVLKESESIFWMTFLIVLVVMPVFMSAVPVMARWVGVQYPPALLFTIAIMFCIFMLFRFAAAISVLGEKIKDIAQANAIMEKS